MRFYTCTKCGSLITSSGDLVEDIYCCGKRASELTPEVSGTFARTHAPILSREGDLITVRVGEQAHPMTPTHAILWVLLVSREGVQKKAVSEIPEVTFALTPGDRAVAAYAFCNEHGLFMTRIGGV